jgi:hypothetical protein
MWEFLRSSSMIAPTTTIASDFSQQWKGRSMDVKPKVRTASGDDARFGPVIASLIRQGKLSDVVVEHGFEIHSGWTEVDLYGYSPYNKPALNLQLREYGWELLSLWQTPEHGGLTMQDYLVLMASQHTLLDLTHAERYSPLYAVLIMRWVSECSWFLDVVDRDRDEATSDLLIHLCMKLSGTLTAPFLRLQSSSYDDPRFHMYSKMMYRYPSMRDWEVLMKVLRQFTALERCIRCWKRVWDMYMYSQTVEGYEGGDIT